MKNNEWKTRSNLGKRVAENTIPIEATPQKYVRKIQGDTTKMLTDHTTMEQKYIR